MSTPPKSRSTKIRKCHNHCFHLSCGKPLLCCARAYHRSHRFSDNTHLLCCTPCDHYCQEKLILEIFIGMKSNKIMHKKQ
uniref:Uncharacterized protein n=1 Tax=Parascaris univalens TaxID=6257 RepID=A0A915ABI4_PARUN